MTPPDPLVRTFAPDARELVGIRRDVRAHLIGLGVDDERIAALVLATNEAVANAILHAAASPADPILVRVGTRGADIVIEVRDTGAWIERPRPREEGGRGLEIARRLVDRLAIDRRSDGTTVVLCG